MHSNTGASFEARFGAYYHHNTKGRDARKGSKRLPTPLVKVETGPGKITVQMRGEWLQEHKAFYEKIPLPLPHQAAAQNLVLLIMVSNPYAYKWRSRRELCHILGIDHKRRNKVLDQAIENAKAWFKKHGGSLMELRKGKRIEFIVTKPCCKEERKRRKIQEEAQALGMDQATAKPRVERLLPRRKVDDLDALREVLDHDLY
jgi:hypothetical protein